MAFIGPTFFPPLGPATGQPPVNPQGWDRCTLAGQPIPGHCRIVHGLCRLKKDAKSKNGADGSNPTYRGMDPQPLQMEITTYTDADREKLALVILQYVPKPGIQPKPVSIDHPSLRVIGVDSVMIEGASALIPEPGTTKAKMTLDMFHWLPAKPENATTTPKVLVRNVQNLRKKPSDTNKLPTQQPGFGAPPAKLGNGQ